MPTHYRVFFSARLLGSLASFQPPGGNVLFAGLDGGIFLLVLAMIIIAKMLPGT
jgi:hypothetical protein